MKLNTFVCFLLLVAGSFNLVVAQTFSLSDRESSVSFTIRNFGLNVDGTFSGLSGTIDFDSDAIENSSFVVKVESSSINTGIDLRDKHLKKEGFLDATRFPYIHFISTKVSKTDKENVYHVNGKLTIKGMTKEIGFIFTVAKKINDIQLKGDLKINRRDFNVGGNSLSMDDTVKIQLDVIAHVLVD